MASVLDDLDTEVQNVSRDVYLVTISRWLPGLDQREGTADITALSSQQVGDAVRLAAPAAGRLPTDTVRKLFRAVARSVARLLP